MIFPVLKTRIIEGEPTGLKLPYVVTIEKNSGEILSLARNWDEQDPQQKPLQSFVHYKFLPGFGFYGFGLIHMIGGLSRAATSILRQLIDAGTLSNLPAGFKSRGTRIRNDDEPIQPGEFVRHRRSWWRHVRSRFSAFAV